MLPGTGSWNASCRVGCSWKYHSVLCILLLGLPLGKEHVPHRHLREDTCIIIHYFSEAYILCYSSMFNWHTNNELTVIACYEHGCFLLLGSFWLTGSNGFLCWGSEGDRQEAWVLWSPSRTRQSCSGHGGDYVGAATSGHLGGHTIADSNLLWRSPSGHNVNHSLLVALHAGTQLRQ